MRVRLVNATNVLMQRKKVISKTGLNDAKSWLFVGYCWCNKCYRTANTQVHVENVFQVKVDDEPKHEQ